jgi:tRNA pseudouridine55 synthase
MTARRGATDLAGVVLIDKPAGMTSHDVIGAMRRATGERRIGHAGTLDPMATGLLLVLVGRATRLERYLVGHDKRYEATIAFGTATDTLDVEGEVTDTAPVPEALFQPETARMLLRTMLGQSDQMPPAYSAIKRDGVPAYRLARAGGTPDLEPRAIEVSEATLRDLDADAGTWDVTFTVSSGTYVRSLARDLGLAAGTVAHLASLRRTRVASAELTSAWTLDEAVRRAGNGEFAVLSTDPIALLELAVMEVATNDVKDGRAVRSEAGTVPEGTRVALTGESALLGVYVQRGDRLVPETVFVPGVAR